MIHSGIDGFAWVDEADLRLALGRLRGSGLPMLVHQAALAFQLWTGREAPLPVMFAAARAALP